MTRIGVTVGVGVCVGSGVRVGVEEGSAVGVGVKTNGRELQPKLDTTQSRANAERYIFLFMTLYKIISLCNKYLVSILL